jgi:hypothetical protein
MSCLILPTVGSQARPELASTRPCRAPGHCHTLPCACNAVCRTAPAHFTHHPSSLSCLVCSQAPPGSQVPGGHTGQQIHRSQMPPVLQQLLGQQPPAYPGYMPQLPVPIPGFGVAPPTQFGLQDPTGEMIGPRATAVVRTWWRSDVHPPACAVLWLQRLSSC